ncbi:ATP phosphoribosyltransferase [Candidatus Bipolaricaulota bacterium]|nr:ATP phosphoribosyltransferase [Candidatus Bipolaricaulota bacterium]
MKIVLPSGRLLEDSISVLRQTIPGLTIEKNRELTHSNGNHEVLLAKPADVPTYVEEGADIGITGRDVVHEKSPDVFVPLSLPFGQCRVSVARMDEDSTTPRQMDGYRIATEYPSITREFFRSLGVAIEVIVVDGSTELAPSAGIADAVVDVVQTGNTLAANGLVEAKTILESSALLLVNRISQKTQFDRVNELVYSIREVVKNGS